MKKGLRYSAFLVSAVLVLAVAVLVITIFPMFSMKPVETGPFHGTDIYAIQNNRNNLFLFETGGGYALIDAGSNAAAIKEALAQMSIDMANVKHVLLTHTDSDHVAALGLFPGAAIYLSEDEAPMINGEVKRSAFSSNALPKDIDMGRLVWLTDQQELLLGKHTVQCIKTPGHTLGSMSFLLDEQYLFTGDAARIENGSLSIHPFTMDENTAKASIAIIDHLRESCELVLTAHYGCMPNVFSTISGNRE